MDSTTIGMALALLLLVEGLVPFVSPARWRRVFEQLLRLTDGQIRFFAALSISAGLVLIWVLAP